MSPPSHPLPPSPPHSTSLSVPQSTQPYGIIFAPPTTDQPPTLTLNLSRHLDSSSRHLKFQDIAKKPTVSAYFPHHVITASPSMVFYATERPVAAVGGGKGQNRTNGRGLAQARSSAMPWVRGLGVGGSESRVLLKFLQGPVADLCVVRVEEQNSREGHVARELLVVVSVCGHLCVWDTAGEVGAPLAEANLKVGEDSRLVSFPSICPHPEPTFGFLFAVVCGGGVHLASLVVGSGNGSHELVVRRADVSQFVCSAIVLPPSGEYLCLGFEDGSMRVHEAKSGATSASLCTLENPTDAEGNDTTSSTNDDGANGAPVTQLHLLHEDVFEVKPTEYMERPAATVSSGQSTQQYQHLHLFSAGDHSHLAVPRPQQQHQHQQQPHDDHDLSSNNSEDLSNACGGGGGGGAPPSVDDSVRSLYDPSSVLSDLEGTIKTANDQDGNLSSSDDDDNSGQPGSRTNANAHTTSTSKHHHHHHHHVEHVHNSSKCGHQPLSHDQRDLNTLLAAPPSEADSTRSLHDTNSVSSLMSLTSTAFPSTLASEPHTTTTAGTAANTTSSHDGAGESLLPPLPSASLSAARLRFPDTSAPGPLQLVTPVPRAGGNSNTTTSKRTGSRKLPSMSSQNVEVGDSMSECSDIDVSASVRCNADAASSVHLTDVCSSVGGEVSDQDDDDDPTPQTSANDAAQRSTSETQMSATNAQRSAATNADPAGTTTTTTTSSTTPEPGVSAAATQATAGGASARQQTTTTTAAVTTDAAAVPSTTTAATGVAPARTTSQTSTTSSDSLMPPLIHITSASARIRSWYLLATTAHGALLCLCKLTAIDSVAPVHEEGTATQHHEQHRVSFSVDLLQNLSLSLDEDADALQVGGAPAGTTTGANMKKSPLLSVAVVCLPPVGVDSEGESDSESDASSANQNQASVSTSSRRRKAAAAAETRNTLVLLSSPLSTNIHTLQLVWDGDDPKVPRFHFVTAFSVGNRVLSMHAQLDTATTARSGSRVAPPESSTHHDNNNDDDQNNNNDNDDDEDKGNTADDNDSTHVDVMVRRGGFNAASVKSARDNAAGTRGLSGEVGIFCVHEQRVVHYVARLSDCIAPSFETMLQERQKALEANDKAKGGDDIASRSSESVSTGETSSTASSTDNAAGTDEAGGVSGTAKQQESDTGSPGSDGYVVVGIGKVPTTSTPTTTVQPPSPSPAVQPPTQSIQDLLAKAAANHQKQQHQQQHHISTPTSVTPSRTPPRAPSPSDNTVVTGQQNQQPAPALVRAVVDSLLMDGRMQAQISRAVEQAITNHLSQQMFTVMQQYITPSLNTHINRAVQSCTSGMDDRIRNVLIPELTSQMVPMMHSALETLQQQTTSHETLDTLAHALKPVAVQSFCEAFSATVVPAHEEATKRMFSEVSTAFDKGVKTRLREAMDQASTSNQVRNMHTEAVRQALAERNAEEASARDALTAQLAALTKLVEENTQTLKSLRNQQVSPLTSTSLEETDTAVLRSVVRGSPAPAASPLQALFQNHQPHMVRHHVPPPLHTLPVASPFPSPSTATSMQPLYGYPTPPAQQQPPQNFGGSTTILAHGPPPTSVIPSPSSSSPPSSPSSPPSSSSLPNYGASPAPHAASILPKMALASSLESLVCSKMYNDAFFKALEASDLDVVDWLCVRVAPSDVLEPSTTPYLSQCVILSLVQQLTLALLNPPGSIVLLPPSTSTSHNDSSSSGSVSVAERRVEWLQKLLLCLKPTDKTIANHVVLVLSELVRICEEVGVLGYYNSNDRFRIVRALALNTLSKRDHAHAE